MKNIEFDWDQWNIQKNEIKHGVSFVEAESVFFDPYLQIHPTPKHSTLMEVRYFSYGRSLENRVLLVGFTIRNGKFRIITARPASKKERQVYENEKEKRIKGNH